jgi:valine dehydrogenase (NAD+)
MAGILAYIPNIVRCATCTIEPRPSISRVEHEEVLVRRGSRSGLPVVVAIHSRALGPAAGGTRMRSYPDWRDGLADALLLSEAMTYKCAASGLDFGGGKAVIAVPPDGRVDRRAALLDVGELIDSLGGSFLAGPDVGTGPEDMLVMRQTTRYAYCLPEEHGGTGSSSPSTAAGVLAALRAAARQVLGTDSVDGRRIVISGLGSVGAILARALANAKLTVSDIDPSKRAIAREIGADWVDPQDAYTVPSDILIPAAVGGVLDHATIDRLSATLVVGPANNQLADPGLASVLADRNVTWIPDFLASAGGVVYILGREFDGLDHKSAMERVEAIGTAVTEVLNQPGTPLDAAMRLARTRLSP